MRIPFGTSSSERDKGDRPKLPVVNMYAENAPTEEGGVVLQSRYGFVAAGITVAGNVVQVFSKDGVFSSDLFSVSGGNLYRGATSLGTVAGSGAVSICGNEIGVFATAGTVIRHYDGTTLANVAFPDGADVIKVLIAASRLVAIRKDTGQFYFSPVLEATIDALDFATAENSPDRLLDAVFVDDILVLFGKETVEFWPNTGDSEAPFTPLEGRVIEKGIKATSCAVVFDSDIAWIANDGTVRKGQGGQIISDHGLEEKIGDSTDWRLWTYQEEGHEMLAVRVDGGTWVFSNRNGLWSELQTYGESNILVQCYANGYFGSTDGLKQASTAYLDGSNIVERRFRAGFPLNGGAAPVHSLRIRTNPGNTSFLTGDYVSPRVEARISRNAGKTWGNWRAADLGRQGDYNQTVEWRGWGTVKSPGALFEFRVTDPVPFAVSGVFVNEDRP